MIFFLVFGFVAVVLANPETQTVSHSFPKVCAAVAKKFAESALAELSSLEGLSAICCG